MTAPFDLRLFATGALAFAAIGAMPALMGAAGPGWAAAFGLGEGEAGTAVAAFNAGAVATVLMGIMGRSLPLRPALALLALGAAGVAVAPAWGAVLGAAGVAGGGYGVLAVAVNRRFLLGFGARGPGMVGLVNGVFGMGAIAAPLLFLAVGQGAGWLVAAAALAALSLAPPEDGARAPAGLPRVRPGHAALLALNMGAVAIENSLVAHGAAALVARGQGEGAAAAWLSAFFASYVAARVALFWVAGRVDPRALFTGAALGVTASMGLALLAPTWGFAAAGAFAATGFPAFFVWSSRALGTDPRVGALVLLSGLTAATLGPVLARPILAATGEGALFAILGAFGAVLSVILLAAGPRLARVAPIVAP